MLPVRPERPAKLTPLKFPTPMLTLIKWTLLFPDIRGHPPSVSFRFWLPSTLVFPASVTMASPVQLPLTSAFSVQTGKSFPMKSKLGILPVFSRVWVRAGSVSGTSTVITAPLGGYCFHHGTAYSSDGSTWSNGYRAAWHFQKWSAHSHSIQPQTTVT